MAGRVRVDRRTKSGSADRVVAVDGHIFVGGMKIVADVLVDKW